NPEHTWPEIDFTNNTLSQDAVFLFTEPACLHLIPVRTHASYECDASHLGWCGVFDVISRFETLWPVPEASFDFDFSDVAELEACTCFPIPFQFGPYELPEDDWKIIGSLMTREFLDYFSGTTVGCE